MIGDCLLALGLLLTSASQLRPVGGAIGAGESLLAIWLIISLGREIARLGPPLSPPLCRLFVFWALFALALSVGTATGFVIGDRHDPDLLIHDLLAYLLAFGVSCLAVVEPEASRRLHRIAWLLAGFGTPYLALQLANAWGVFHIPSSDPWYWNRLRGWSQNPNSLAHYCAILGLLSVYLADTATRLGARIVAISCAILPIYVGRLTRSDSFSLVLVAAVPILAALKFRSWLLAAHSSLTVRSAAALIVALALPAALAAAIPLGYSITVQAEGFAKGLSKDNGTGTEQEALLRLQSWNEAVLRGLESGMLGLGPGPHLETPFALLASRRTEKEPINIEHPPRNGTPNFEAHNTLLDLFTQGGLLAASLFLWLMATTIWSTYRAQLNALTALLCGVGIFSIFHFFFRHPILWFAIALGQVAAQKTRQRSAVPNSS